MAVNQPAEFDSLFAIHLGGKLEVASTVPLESSWELSAAYTPGVAQICDAIVREPVLAYEYTLKGSCVAVVTDGTAVLGLGNVGPLAAMPVMEGKAAIFKRFAGVDAFPLCLDARSPRAVVDTVRAIAPGFGGILLEDIASPHCFTIERELVEALDIPVFHDDQHGTAIVVLAALLNAARVVGKRLADLRIVICGAGAAGIATARFLLDAGSADITLVDRHGIVAEPALMDDHRRDVARMCNPRRQSGGLRDALRGADVFVGVSGPGVLTAGDVSLMARDPIVLALANPTPEILPEETQGLAAVMATGRSDYPNQVNNALAFPGVFRGALAVRASRINGAMKLAAAQALARAVGDCLSAERILPSLFDRSAVESVARAVANAARRSGLA
jgi:malate dehydrogenase (oxaloacetate-decarboxylating)